MWDTFLPCTIIPVDLVVAQVVLDCQPEDLQSSSLAARLEMALTDQAKSQARDHARNPLNGGNKHKVNEKQSGISWGVLNSTAIN